MKGIFFALCICVVSANLSNFGADSPAAPSNMAPGAPSMPPPPSTPPMMPAVQGSVGCVCSSKYYYNKTDCSGAASQTDSGTYATNCAVNLNGKMGYTKSYQFNDDCTAIVVYNTADCSGTGTPYSSQGAGKCFQERLASSSGSEIVTCTKAPQKKYPLSQVCKLMMSLYGADPTCSSGNVTYHSVSYLFKSACNTYTIGGKSYYITPTADCAAGQMYSDSKCTSKVAGDAGLVWQGKCDKSPADPSSYESVTIAAGDAPTPKTPTPSATDDTPNGAVSLLPSLVATLTVLIASLAM